MPLYFSFNFAFIPGNTSQKEKFSDENLDTRKRTMGIVEIKRDGSGLCLPQQWVERMCAACIAFWVTVSLQNIQEITRCCWFLSSRVATVKPGKIWENRFFSRSGSCMSVREFLNSAWKSVKSHGILLLASEGVFVSKIPAIELISVANSLLVLLPCGIVSENWSLVNEKSMKSQGNGGKPAIHFTWRSEGSIVMIYG